MISCSYVNIMWELYLKGQEGANVKACTEFCNDLMKMFLNTKQERNGLKVGFYHVDCDLNGTFLS